LLGNQLFPADYPWNQNISAAPVAANSNAIINNIINLYGNGKLHPDFGQDYHNSNQLYGIPYNVVRGNSTPKTNITIDAYASESDIEAVPLPANPVLEGDFQNGPDPSLADRGDSHLIVYDVDNNIAYEFYHASRPSENSDGNWHADQESVWNMNTDSFRTIGWTSADAAGLSILAGLVRPDEGLPTSEGGQGAIDHAVRMTLENSIILDQFLYPASHVADSNTNAAIDPPMGARFRLKAGVDISNFDPESKVIAQAMKDYGLIVADNGSNFFVTGASYAVDANNQQTLTWNDNDINDTLSGLKSLTFSDFEVVNPTPVVSGLSTNFGAAGTSVTILGQNFSGAAGHLQVLFGGTPATSVTVVDDSHVIAVAPAGSGTVDVQVQSGITEGNDPENINSPVFGYDVSATSTADQFTYGTDLPPGVATPAAANPSLVTGRTTNLSVLGSDDDGESSLIYNWAVVGPGGVSFSVNGTNAAKNTAATFSTAGSYTFTATITDLSGLTITSSVNVAVEQKLTAILVHPNNARVVVNHRLQFLATAYDQFGQALNTQPAFTWTLSGAGYLSKRGLYTAPGQAGGPYRITATVHRVKATARVVVINRRAPRAAPVLARDELFALVAALW
jgi:hypothetical protein